MPVGFLTDEQRRRYGHFHRTPTPEECTRYFHLDDTDRNLIADHRGDHNRLGFAVQLCTARFLGTFLDDLSDVPPSVVSLLAQQLSIEKSDCFNEYSASRQRWDHTGEIRRHGGYTDYSDPIKQFRLMRWLYALSWT